MFISTGMCNLADIYEALEVIKSVDNQDTVLLHCTSLYPTLPQHVNLRAMDTLRNAFYLPVGYSDHTTSMYIPAVAVARGACVIEKHFTISRELKGPDHSYSLEPEELTQMVAFIREVEQSLGSPFKRMLPEEKQFARRESLFAQCDIPIDQKIESHMIVVKRSAMGVEPRFIQSFVGQKAKRYIKKDDPFSWDHI